MTTKNWRIRKVKNDFFIEADLPNAIENGHYPRIELMQDDFGDHNGYTEELRMEDAKLIVNAQKMKDAIDEVLEVLHGPGIPNTDWIMNRLLKTIED